MFARIARYEIDADRVNETVESFREASTQLVELHGYTSGYMLVDRENGGFATLTVWDNRRSMEDSRTRAGMLRQQAVKHGSVISVSEYEIAFDFPARPL